MHQQFQIFRQCVLTACNYGPLLDAANDKESYKEIDVKLAWILKRILNN